MNKRYGYLLIAGLLLLAGTLILVIGLLAVGMLRQRQERARGETLPPVVQIIEPQVGMSALVDSYLPVIANIYDSVDAPLHRVEVWLDGELQEEREATAAEGTLPSLLYAHFLMPSEGIHLLTVRAVNRLGIIGQSEPLLVVGNPKPQEALLLVPLPEGGSLASLAAAYHTDEATLQVLNPSLDGQPPAPGSIITVPKLAEDEPPPAAQPSLPLPGDFQPINPAVIPLDPAGLSVWNLTLLTALPPAAPSGLLAQVKECRVTLVWNDNSDNENGFELWMSGTNSPAQIIAVLQPSPGGQTWFEFPAPAGGHLSFWMEAYNSIGSQPSNIILAEVDSKCSTASPTHLQIDLQDMSVSGNYDRAYCYVSLEGAPETRLPEQDGNFIPVQGGQGNITAWSHVYSVPIPADNSVEVSGECWGWAGSALVKLGTFSKVFPIQTWNGGRHMLDGGAFQIGIAVAPLGATNPGGAQVYDYFPDPLLPPPYGVQEEGTRCPGFNCSGVFLAWKWQPSPAFKQQITGFEIYLDGNSYQTVSDPKARSTPVSPPAGCGKPVRWQVAAVAGTVRSMLSLPFEYDLPACQAYALVKFETLEIPWTGDGLSDGPCDELQLYYELGLTSPYGHVMKEFGWGGDESGLNPVVAAFFPTYGLFFLGKGSLMELLSIRCTKDGPPYTFAALGSAFGVQNPDTLIVSIPESNISIGIGTFFYDQDSSSANDNFGFRLLNDNYPDLQAAQTDLGCGKTFRDPTEGYRIEDNADTAIRYTLTVYPNPCGVVPQGIPLPTHP